MVMRILIPKRKMGLIIFLALFVIDVLNHVSPQKRLNFNTNHENKEKYKKRMNQSATVTGAIPLSGREVKPTSCKKRYKLTKNPTTRANNKIVDSLILACIGFGCENPKLVFSGCHS